jgi:hypothetical protein
VAEVGSMREAGIALPQINSSSNFELSMGTRIDEFHRLKGVVFSPPAFGAPELVTT